MRRRLAIAAIAFLVAAALVVALRPILGPDADPAGDDAPAASDRPDAAGRASAGAGLSAVPAAEPGRAPAAAAGAPPESFGPVRAIAFVGRVVDAERRPEPDAQVRFVCDVLTARATRTEADGRFRIEASGRTGSRLYGRGAVHVIARGDRAAVADANFRPLDGGEEDLGTIEVAPTHSLRVRVAGTDGPAAGAVVTVSSQGAGTRAVEIGRAVAGSDGEVRFDHVPAGLACVWAAGARGSVGRATVALPLERADVPLDVLLAPARTLRVEVYEPRGSDVPAPLNDEADVPIVGAVVRPYLIDGGGARWWPPPVGAPWSLAGTPPTALDGATSVIGLPADGRVEVTVEAEGHASASVEVAAGRPRAVVHLRRAARSTFLVLGKTPPDGTRLTVVSYGGSWERSGTRAGVVEGGRVVLDGDDPFEWGVAKAPDGTIAVLEAGNSLLEGRATAFAPGRRLVVRVLQADGAPLEGVEVRVGEADSRRTLPPARTDAAGTATFDALTPGPWLARGFAPENDGGVELGAADLTDADGTIEARFEAERTLRLRATVDGDRRLPSGLSVAVDPAVVTATEEDGASGTLFVRARPRDLATPAHVWLRGKGVIEAGAPFAWPAAGSTLSLDLALETACAVEVTVTPHPARRPDVFLERDAGDGTFVEAAGDARRLRRAETVVFERLRAGRYRLRDGDSDAVTETVEVRARTPRARLVLDLAALARVRGRVDAPAGTDLSKARIVVSGPGLDPVPDGFSGDHVDADGTFDVLVTAGARTTLRVWHPELASVAGAGSVVVEGRRDDVRLRLGEGAKLLARLKDESGAPLPEWLAAEASVFVEAREAVGIVERTLVPDGSGAVAAAGFATGPLDAWIAVDGLAPRRLARVDVKDGVTDLGDVRLEKGSGVTVRAPRVAGKVVEGFRAEAEFLGPVPFSRDLGEDPDGLWHGGGLCAGRWRLTLSWSARSGGRVEERREVDVDGHADVTVDLAGK